MAVKFEYTGKLNNGRFFDATSTKKVTFEIDDDDLSLGELLDEFANFLRATGYAILPEDHLEVVNDFKQSTDKYKDWGWDNPLSSGLSGEKPEITDPPQPTDNTQG